MHININKNINRTSELSEGFGGLDSSYKHHGISDLSSKLAVNLNAVQGDLQKQKDLLTIREDEEE
jgi:hypothetical protein